MADRIQKFGTVSSGDMKSISTILNENIGAIGGIVHAPYTILFQDDMTGAITDTVKWTETNTNPTYLIRTWTGSELKVQQSSIGASYSHTLTCNTTPVPASEFVYAIDQKIDVTSTSFFQPSFFRLQDGRGASIFMGSYGGYGGLGFFRISIVDSSATVIYSNNVNFGWVDNVYMSIRIRYDGATLYFEKWASSVWTTVFSIAAPIFATEGFPFIPVLAANVGADPLTTTYRKNLYVTDAPYSTQYPL